MRDYNISALIKYTDKFIENVNIVYTMSQQADGNNSELIS